MVQIRPEAERKLRAGFQRRADEQSARYAAQLAHAGQLAARFGCGEVAGVFSGQAGGGVRHGTYVVGLLPLAAVPLLIVCAAAGVPGVLPVLGAFPFVAGAWIGVSFWQGREPRRRVWFYAFAEGFMLLDDPRTEAAPVRWSQVTEVGEVWTEVYRPGEEDSRPALAAYQLRSADGRAHEISRSFRNVQDPYGEVGHLLKGLAPGSVGRAMPEFPTIDEIIATYARKPGPGARGSHLQIADSDQPAHLRRGLGWLRDRRRASCGRLASACRCPAGTFRSLTLNRSSDVISAGAGSLPARPT